MGRWRSAAWVSTPRQQNAAAVRWSAGRTSARCDLYVLHQDTGPRRPQGTGSSPGGLSEMVHGDPPGDGFESLWGAV
ncbi:unnamed protein product [Boreogadus saida]